MDGFLIFTAVMALSIGVMVAFFVYIFRRGPQVGKDASRSAAIWSIRSVPDTGDPLEPPSEKRSPRYWRVVGMCLLFAAVMSLGRLLVTGEVPQSRVPF